MTAGGPGLARAKHLGTTPSNKACNAAAQVHPLTHSRGSPCTLITPQYAKMYSIHLGVVKERWVSWRWYDSVMPKQPVMKYMPINMAKLDQLRGEHRKEGRDRGERVRRGG